MKSGNRGELRCEPATVFPFESQQRVEQFKPLRIRGFRISGNRTRSLTPFATNSRVQYREHPGDRRIQTNATNLTTELAALAETLGMDPVRVRSSIYAKALTLRAQSDLPLDQLTASLMKGVADYLAIRALRGQRPSFDEAIEEAARSIFGSCEMPE